MPMSFSTCRTTLIGLTLTASLFVFAGCSKKEAATDTPASTTASAANGQAVFSANCARCHSGGGRAPDLSHAGADPKHTAQWLAEFIKDPKSKDPGSRMPAMDKLSDSDLQAVSAYLAGLK